MPRPAVTEINSIVNENFKVIERVACEGRHSKYLLECLTCGHRSDIFRSNFHRVKCPVCQPSAFRDRTKGVSKTATYKLWSTMITRCNCEFHSSYKYYGAKGIKVCEEWLHSYRAFLRDMGERPTDGLYDLHRIDPEEGYCKENCQWLDRHEHRSNHAIENRS